jgi:methylase of polypeptide subunit release factors
MQIISLLQDPTFPNKIVLEKLLCAICGRDKTTIYTHYERELTGDDYQKINDAYHRVIDEQRPLEYAIGYVTFDHKQFFVSSDTLIPRPETEYMIIAVKEYLAQTNNPHTLIDLGTGCGVLGICAYLAGGEKITHAYLTDVSEPALVVAQKNVDKHIPDAHNITLLASDMFNHPALLPLLSGEGRGEGSLVPWKGGSGGVLVPSTEKENAQVPPLNKGGQEGLLIVANLPYIPEDLFDNNVDITVKKREPKFAFVWWKDGLDRYRIMFDTLTPSPFGAVTPSPSEWGKAEWTVGTSVPLEGRGLGWGQTEQIKSPILFLEMMTRQVDLLRQAYGENWLFEEVQTFHFNIRIVRAERK